MTLVNVINDNKHTFTQEWKSVKYAIEPGKSIVMDETEAHEFLGAFSPVYRDADGQFDPRSFKMLRIEKMKVAAPKPEVSSEFKCQACGYSATSKADLDDHILANHSEQLVDAEVAEELKKKKGK